MRLLLKLVLVAALVLLAPITLMVVAAPSSSTKAVADVALVLGAGLRSDGTASDLLAARVTAAASLYRAGLVQRLVLSGTRTIGHDEPGAMSALATESGVPPSALVLDPFGDDTRASCQHVFELGFRTVVVATQPYHMPRALWLCRRSGLSATPCPPLDVPQVGWSLRAREVAAAWKALF